MRDEVQEQEQQAGARANLLLLLGAPAPKSLHYKTPAGRSTAGVCVVSPGT